MTTRARRAFRGLGATGVVLGLMIGGSSTGFSHASASASASPVPVGIVQHARLVSARSTVPVTTTEYSVQVGDVTRDYLLGGAPAMSGSGAPLLLLFHGLDEATPDFLGDVDILDAAARAGVVVAAPISPDDAWNDGRFGPTGPDDDGFAMAIIAQLAAAGTIDPARVTVAGFSNGAGMAIELASRHPDAVAAFVSVDGEALSGPNQTLPSAPIPAFFIHGTDDSVQPIQGRDYESDRFPGYVSEAQTIEGFLAADGVAAATPVQVQAPRHRGTPGAATITRWSSPGAVSVTFASIAGMGHTWPTLACTPLAISPQRQAKMTQAKDTAARVAALRAKIRRRKAGPALVKSLPALVRRAATQAAAVRKATAAAAVTAAAEQAAVAALLPHDGDTSCNASNGPNTRSTDVSADSLILGVALSARQGSYSA